jgi:hypothetical protein
MENIPLHFIDVDYCFDEGPNKNPYTVIDSEP